MDFDWNMNIEFYVPDKEISSVCVNYIVFGVLIYNSEKKN